MASRNVDDLLPHVAQAARAHAEKCAATGVEILVYCTLRDAKEQSDLFAKGRTQAQIQNHADRLARDGYPQLGELLRRTPPQPGPRVTHAGPGESFHQYGLAYDCVPIVGGKCLWSTTGTAREVWQTVGRLGRDCGLEWAGDWTHFVEFPHFQVTAGWTIPDLMQEYYGEGQPAVLTAEAFYEETESQALRDALDERDESGNPVTTKFMVLASVPGVSEEQLTGLHADAQIVKNLNPAARRVFWVRQPDKLSATLTRLLWGGGAPSVGTVLSTGTGLKRKAKTFGYAELNTFAKMMLAFAWEPGP